jgi:hypothetical protein
LIITSDEGPEVFLPLYNSTIISAQPPQLVNFTLLRGTCVEKAGILVAIFQPVSLCTLLSEDIFLIQKTLELISQHMLHRDLIGRDIPFSTTVQLLLHFLDAILQIPQNLFTPRLELRIHLLDGFRNSGVPREEGEVPDIVDYFLALLLLKPRGLELRCLAQP